ncbi:MAG: hypothetical protein K0Q79_1516 [Flavipsychrobacter sp.]|jgi:hypothetical protein|nr:hypothetical protein [Flavipsychrobacter sp.]
MNSPFALLFLAMQERIGAIIDPDTSDPLFAFIDQDYGQLERTISGLPSVSFPCALIDIEDADFDNAGDNTQTATLKISIRVGFAPYSSTSGLTPEEWKLRALAFYEQEQALHLALQGWSPGEVTITEEPLATADLSDTFGHFIRVHTHSERRVDTLRIRHLTYTIGMQDYSTRPVVTMAEVEPDIEDEVI